MAENDKDGKLATVVVAALVGGIAGAAMGLLLAPKPGKELRQELEEKAQELGDKALVLGDKAQKVWHNIEERAEEKAETLQMTGQDVIREGRRLVSDLKALVREMRQGLNAKTGTDRVVEAGQEE